MCHMCGAIVTDVSMSSWYNTQWIRSMKAFANCLREIIPWLLLILQSPRSTCSCTAAVCCHCHPCPSPCPFPLLQSRLVSRTTHAALTQCLQITSRCDLWQAIGWMPYKATFPVTTSHSLVHCMCRKKLNRVAEEVSSTVKGGHSTSTTQQESSTQLNTGCHILSYLVLSITRSARRTSSHKPHT
jgi:hypothetical protein